MRRTVEEVHEDVVERFNISSRKIISVFLKLIYCHSSSTYTPVKLDLSYPGYSESIAEMCDELQNGSLPLLIVTPNGRDDTGTNRDCYLLNPAATSPLHMTMFRFLGMLMGIAIRTGSPLSLNLAEPVWKQLAGMPLTPADLTEVDRDYVPGKYGYLMNSSMSGKILIWVIFHSARDTWAFDFFTATSPQCKDHKNGILYHTET